MARQKISEEGFNDIEFDLGDDEEFVHDANEVRIRKKGSGDVSRRVGRSRTDAQPEAGGADNASLQAYFNALYALGQQQVDALKAGGLAPEMRWSPNALGKGKGGFIMSGKTVESVDIIKQRFETNRSQIDQIARVAYQSGRAPRITVGPDGMISLQKGTNGEMLFDETEESRANRRLAGEAVGFVGTDLMQPNGGRQMVGGTSAGSITPGQNVQGPKSDAIVGVTQSSGKTNLNPDPASSGFNPINEPTIGGNPRNDAGLPTYGGSPVASASLLNSISGQLNGGFSYSHDEAEDLGGLDPGDPRYQPGFAQNYRVYGDGNRTPDGQVYDIEEPDTGFVPESTEQLPDAGFLPQTTGNPLLDPFNNHRRGGV